MAMIEATRPSFGAQGNPAVSPWPSAETTPALSIWPLALSQTQKQPCPLSSVFLRALRGKPVLTFSAPQRLRVENRSNGGHA
jgi:hypothetical protein